MFQEGGTCYAHAVATILYLVSRRVVGYTPASNLNSKLGYGGLSFNNILDKLVKGYGKCGANTKCVLDDWCRLFRFHCQRVDEEGARTALNKQRPVVATFGLEGNQWEIFSKFWKWPKQKKNVMEADDLPKGVPDINSGRHAVCLISHGKNGLRFLNSWGSDWGDGGFFRVANGKVLDMTFYDVFFYESDLTQEEKSAWKNKANEALQDLEKLLPHSGQTCIST